MTSKDAVPSRDLITVALCEHIEQGPTRKRITAVYVLFDLQGDEVVQA